MIDSRDEQKLMTVDMCQPSLASNHISDLRLYKTSFPLHLLLLYYAGPFNPLVWRSVISRSIPSAQFQPSVSSHSELSLSWVSNHRSHRLVTS